jgi:hypothetical protein
MDLYDGLITFVGDADALWRLDSEPLPDEPFEWPVIGARDRAFVSGVLALSDRCCDVALDVEYRTIARRILARVAAREPTTLRRSANVARFAAGLVWLAGRGSGEFGRRGRLPSQWLWDWFGVNDSADRGRSLRHSAGLEPDSSRRYLSPSEPLPLGDPGLLHSRFRSRLIMQRDARATWQRDRRRWWLLEDGRTASVRAAPVKVVLATKGLIADQGRAMVILGLGDNLDEASFFALTIPEAHGLVRSVQGALDAPLPRNTTSSESTADARPVG